MVVTDATMRAWAMKLRIQTSLAIPTDLDAIANIIDVYVMESDSVPNEIRGMRITHPRGQVIAVVRKTLTHQCRRFTIAHEYGHHLINKTMQATGTSCKSVSKGHIERLCNHFAAELLMPEPDVNLYAPQHNWGINETGLRELANHFEVSVQAMRIRLQELRIPAWWWDEQDVLGIALKSLRNAESG